jgi:hypothetical protein
MMEFKDIELFVQYTKHDIGFRVTDDNGNIITKKYLYIMKEKGIYGLYGPMFIIDGIDDV